MRYCSRFLIAAVVLAGLRAAGPQTGPEFEVASVKPAAPVEGPMAAMREGPLADIIGFKGGPGSSDPGRITYSGVSLKQLLMRAYKIKGYQVIGPGWLATERYDIQAKLPPGTDDESLRLMLRRLLLERFQVQCHQEDRTQRAYTLTVAKNGPKLKPPEPPITDPAAMMAETRERMKAMTARIQAGERSGPSRSFGLRSGTVSKFAELLSPHVDGLVIDETGLDGQYSFRVSWRPDEAQPAAPRADSDNTAAGPTIFAALQEQLGLKLEPVKRPVEVLVVDKADKVPTQN